MELMAYYGWQPMSLRIPRARPESVHEYQRRADKRLPLFGDGEPDVEQRSRRGRPRKHIVSDGLRRTNRRIELAERIGEYIDDNGPTPVQELAKAFGVEPMLIGVAVGRSRELVSERKWVNGQRETVVRRRTVDD